MHRYWIKVNQEIIFHNCVQIVVKGRLGLILFTKDGRVIANIHIFLTCV